MSKERRILRYSLVRVNDASQMRVYSVAEKIENDADEHQAFTNLFKFNNVTLSYTLSPFSRLDELIACIYEMRKVEFKNFMVIMVRVLFHILWRTFHIQLL